MVKITLWEQQNMLKIFENQPLLLQKQFQKNLQKYSFCKRLAQASTLYLPYFNKIPFLGI